MSNELDVRRLIAEVHQRPPLWDVRMAEYKDRANTPLLWNEIAEVLRVDVEHCKRKWKNLRDAYRAEVRRTERRIDRLKTLGQFDPSRRLTSKWVYFEPMSFINESKRTSYTARNSVGATECLPERSSGSPDEQPPHQQKHTYEPGFHSFCDIKMETHHTTTDEDDEDDDRLFEEFNAVATPQAARRLSEGFAVNAAAAIEFAGRDTPPLEVTANGTDTQQCKCDQRADEQVHFLEDLEREEQKLMQSTRKEITRANSIGHVGDADYNFLVSFLPQMKKMSELQNLQFRAKMSDLLLNTIATPNTPTGGYGAGCHAAALQSLMQEQQHQQRYQLSSPQLQLQQLQQQPRQPLQLQSLATAAELPQLQLQAASMPNGVLEMATDAAGVLMNAAADGGPGSVELPEPEPEPDQMMQDTDISGSNSATAAGDPGDNDCSNWT